MRRASENFARDVGLEFDNDFFVSTPFGSDVFGHLSGRIREPCLAEEGGEAIVVDRI